MRRKKISIVIAASVVLTTLAVYLWCQRRSAWTAAVLESAGVEPVGQYRRVLFSTGATSFEATCAIFDRSRIRCDVIDLGPDGSTSLNTIFDERRPAFLVNGGYLDAQRKPVGLLRIDGQIVSALLDRSSLSGFLIVDQSGRPALASRADASVATSYSAIQSGPFLIDPGGQIGIRNDPAPPAERTVIAIDHDRICFICTTPIGLLDLSRCLRTHAETFGLTQTDAALNLDGGPSTGFVLYTRKRRVVHEPRGRLRDAVMISPK